MSDHPFPFRIEVRPLLTCGGLGYGPGSIFVLLSDTLYRHEANETLWHEFVHLFLRIGGKTEHDEDYVDSVAKRLAAACPELLALCGIEDKFKVVATSGIEPPRLTASEAGPSAVPGEPRREK